MVRDGVRDGVGGVTAGGGDGEDVEQREARAIARVCVREGRRAARRRPG